MNPGTGIWDARGLSMVSKSTNDRFVARPHPLKRQLTGMSLYELAEVAAGGELERREAIILRMSHHPHPSF
jgi:hypothetical protein